jgi:hypothetical protein
MVSGINQPKPGLIDGIGVKTFMIKNSSLKGREFLCGYSTVKSGREHSVTGRGLLRRGDL